MEEGAQVSASEQPVQDLDWLVTNFVERVRDVAHAVVVTADGLPLAFSARFPRDQPGQQDPQPRCHRQQKPQRMQQVTQRHAFEPLITAISRG